MNHRPTEPTVNPDEPTAWDDALLAEIVDSAHDEHPAPRAAGWRRDGVRVGIAAAALALCAAAAVAIEHTGGEPEARLSIPATGQRVVLELQEGGSGAPEVAGADGPWRARAAGEGADPAALIALATPSGAAERVGRSLTVVAMARGAERARPVAMVGPCAPAPAGGLAPCPGGPAHLAPAGAGAVALGRVGAGVVGVELLDAAGAAHRATVADGMYLAVDLPGAPVAARLDAGEGGHTTVDLAAGGGR